MTPQTFEQWKHCITVDCKINLTKDFASQRLTIYADLNNPESQKFASLYGEGHLQNVISWLKKIVNA